MEPGLQSFAALAAFHPCFRAAGFDAVLHPARFEKTGLGCGSGRIYHGGAARQRRLPHARRTHFTRCVIGVVFGFLRIAWIIIASIFLYHIAVETGQFQIMKESIAALSSD
jgi:hypothetical protein